MRLLDFGTYMGRKRKRQSWARIFAASRKPQGRNTLAKAPDTLVKAERKHGVLLSVRP